MIGSMPVIVPGATMKRHTSNRRPTPGKAGPRSSGRLQRAIDGAARREIEQALRETSGNVLQASRALGISQPSLYGRMNALGIDPAKYRH